MVRLLIRWVLFAIALLFTAWIVPGISFANFYTALAAALVMGLVNTFIRPIILIFTLPLNLVTLGLLTFVINALMFLRWMVRKPPVDLGLWDFIKTSELLIPLDVHVSRISREMGLLQRSGNDIKAVFELSETLKQFSKTDPVKYDFAIFGLGIN